MKALPWMFAGVGVAVAANIALDRPVPWYAEGVQSQ